MIQFIRGSLNWLWVQSERPFQVPADVLAMPGVRYLEPAQDNLTFWRCELPHTVWHTPSVMCWFHALCVVPVRAQFEVRLPARPHHDAVVYGLPVTLPRECCEAFWRLYPHQQAAVEFVLGRSGSLVGDEMGTGKTRAALVAAAIRRWTINPIPGHQGSPVLIVAPKTLRSVWRRELLATGLSDGSDYVELEGLTPHPDPAYDVIRGKRWVFVHYDIMRAWWSFIVRHRPSCVIIDEAHLVNNLRSKRGQAAQLAASGAPFRLVLTGTPILNRIGEFWSLLDLVCGQWTWGSPREYRVRYAGAMEDQHGLKDGPDVTNEEELRSRLACCYIRRELSQVGLHLPELTREIVEVDLQPTHAAKYRELLEDFTPAELLRALLYGGMNKQTLRWIGRLRSVSSQAKVDTTVELVKGLLEEGESVVVFTWQKRTAETIARRSSANAFVVHGDVPQHQRDRMVDAFQTGGGLLVATLGALAVGVTLHKSRIVLMHDLDYVPSIMLQAEARVRRIGQHRPTLSKWLVARGTIDEMIARLFRAKGSLIAQATGDRAPERLADLIGEVDEKLTGDLVRVVEWARRSG